MPCDVKKYRFIICLLLLLAPVTSLLAQPGGNKVQRYTVEHLGRNVNTKFSENGVCVIDDTVMLFSSMQMMEERGSFLEEQPVLMQLYRAPIDADGVPTGEAEAYSTQINSSSMHTYNAAYDARNKQLFFTYCDADDDGVGRCAIYCATRVGDSWKHVHKLGGGVNASGNNTHPTIGYQSDGSVLLYFVSDRAGGMGGSDIWYAILRDGKASNVTNLGSPVNSAANEVTPFYDTREGVLYFSSDRADGIGGYDVYQSQGERDAWRTPNNLGETLNSEQNDLYFTVTREAGGYLTSNRRDSFFSTDSSCCTDLYIWNRSTEDEPLKLTEHKGESIENNADTDAVVAFQESARGLLPISLYFHNDEPDPRSMASTTATTYYQTYNRYMFLRKDYLQAWAAEPDTALRQRQQAGLAQFFDREVQGNCDRLEGFLFFLSEDLWAGRRVSLTLKGYASPLHTSSYNSRLSQRRISSIVNQLREWHGGALRRYLDSGALRITEEAHGSDEAASFHPTATTGDSQRYSVYSIEACHERRIDIVDYLYF